MNTDKLLKEEFFTLFEEKLAEISQVYRKRPFRGAKKQTTVLDEASIEEIRQSFHAALFGDRGINE